MKYKRIIFITKLSAIGDVIIASKAIQYIIQHGYFPVLVTSVGMEDIAALIPNLKAYICIYNKDISKYYFNNCEIDKNNFFFHLSQKSVEKENILLDLQNTSRSKRAKKLLKTQCQLNFKHIYTTNKFTFKRLFLIFISKIKFSQNINNKTYKKNYIYKNHILTIDKLLKKDKIKRKEFDNNQLFLIKSEITLKYNLAEYICIFPGSSSFIKSWPKEKFRELINIIIQNTNLNICICGSNSESYLGEYLSFYDNNRIINLTGKLQLSESLFLIANAKYVVSNDSFAIHASEAYKVPSSVIFGSTSPEFGFSPNYNCSKINYLNLKCSPCTRHGKNSCKYKNLKCFTSIPSISIFNDIKKFL